MRSRGALSGVLAALVLAVALLVVYLRPLDAEPSGPAQMDPESGLPMVALATLPVEARDTLALIDRGGPFLSAKDGAVFGNRERLLPAPAVRLLPRVHGADAGGGRPRTRGAS